MIFSPQSIFVPLTLAGLGASLMIRGDIAGAAKHPFRRQPAFAPITI
jgi:hypothetical protein